MRQSLRVPPSWPTLQRHFEKRRSSVAPSRPDQRMLLRFCSDHQEEVSLLDLGHSNLLLPLWLGRGASPGTYSNHQCLKSLPCFGNHERTLHVFFFPTRRHEMTETPTETPGCQRTGYGHESGSKTWAWESIITLFSITAWGHIIQLGQDLWCDSLGTKPLFNKKKAKSYRTSFTALKMVGDLGHRKEEEMPKTPNQPTNLNHQHPRWRTKAFRTVLQKTFRSCQSCHTLLADSRFPSGLVGAKPPAVLSGGEGFLLGFGKIPRIRGKTRCLIKTEMEMAPLVLVFKKNTGICWQMSFAESANSVVAVMPATNP